MKKITIIMIVIAILLTIIHSITFMEGNSVGYVLWAAIGLFVGAIVYEKKSKATKEKREESKPEDITAQSSLTKSEELKKLREERDKLKKEFEQKAKTKNVTKKPKAEKPHNNEFE